MMETNERMDLTNKRVLNFTEAVLYTGFKPSYLYKLTADNAIPCYRPIGKMLFFRREELENFLTEKTVDEESGIKLKRGIRKTHGT